MNNIGFATLAEKDDAGEIWSTVDLMPCGNHCAREGYGGAAMMARLGYEILTSGEFMARKRDLTIERN